MEQQAYDNKEEGVEAMARRFGAVIGIWLATAGFGEEVATLRSDAFAGRIVSAGEATSETRLGHSHQMKGNE